jgi:hypothetical protein
MKAYQYLNHPVSRFGLHRKESLDVEQSSPTISKQGRKSVQ